MTDKLIHGVDLALTWFNSIPGHWLYTIGVVVASIAVTPIIIENLKKLQLKWTGREMTNHVIDFVLIVTSFLMTAADFVITNGSNAKYLPQFLLVVVPTIKALAPTIYTYSKAIHSWFVNRQAETQQERFQAVLKGVDKLTQTATVTNGTTIATAVPSSPLPPQPSSEKLIQL